MSFMEACVVPDLFFVEKCVSLPLWQSTYALNTLS